MTKEDVQARFNTDYRWLLRGILAIHNQQTLDEKKTESTNHTNHRGFTSTDAKLLSSFAGQILKGYGLSPKQVFIARKKMRKYAGQIVRLSKANVRVENLGKIDEAIRWTIKKNPVQETSIQRAQRVVDEINKRGPGSAVVGCMGGIINFDADGHMRDL
jgi:hypothetical protein